MTTFSHTLALDFLGLRRRRIPAKLAVQMTAAFHSVSEIRVLCAYELYESEAQR